MKILILLPLRSTNDPMLLEAGDYLKRIQRPLTAESHFIVKKNSFDDENIRKQKEGKELLEKSAGLFRIALTEGGKSFDSHQFANLLEKLMLQTPRVAFLIGGAFGLSEEVLEKSDRTLSLSPMTMPHKLAFLVLCEQIYRANEIMRLSPYHK